MRITFVDRNQAVIEAFHSYFKTVPNTDFVIGEFQSVKTEAFITAGNSYGIMDGGIDLVVRNYFPGIQDKVQTKIGGLFLPIGYAISVPTDNIDIPNLIYAPTMEIPSDVKYTLNAYYSFLGALIEASRARFNDIAVCGVCCLTGGMLVDVMARQMYVAYLHWLNGSATNWNTAMLIRKDLNSLVEYIRNS